MQVGVVFADVRAFIYHGYQLIGAAVVVPGQVSGRPGRLADGVSQPA
ncbi:hypothetical protein SDC9_107363 [bioreactor metagenome]|uniref:Uncharacterized protein n=1 Tax=bioreactor metagenome TaxID=1076179 RepID=A0A645B509_9ZZZZ